MVDSLTSCVQGISAWADLEAATSGRHIVPGSQPVSPPVKGGRGRGCREPSVRNCNGSRGLGLKGCRRGILMRTPILGAGDDNRQKGAS